MRKTLMGASILLALGATACGPTAEPSPSSAPSPTVVASAPSVGEKKNMMREWLRNGGDKVTAPLMADLELGGREDWRNDPARAKVLAEAVVKDTKAAMGYRPVPDDDSQQHWVAFLTLMNKIGPEMTTDTGKAAEDLSKASQEYKKVYDRNQTVMTTKE